MRNDRLFSRPGTEGSGRRAPIGPYREVFHPEWEDCSILTQMAEGGSRR